MNTYKFKVLEAEARGSELILVATTEERIQLAAEKHIGHRLTAKELAIVAGFLSMKVEKLAEDKDSIFAEAIREVAELEVLK